MNYGSGEFSLAAVLGTTTATVDPGSTTIFDLTGLLLGNFVISSSVGSTVTINNIVNVASGLTLETNGGAITMGTFVGALGAVAVTIDGGGSFTAGATIIGLLNAGSISFSTGGGTAIIGTASDFINLSFGASINNLTSASDVVDNESLSFAGLLSYTIAGAPDGIQFVTVVDSAGSFSFSTSGSFLTPGTYDTLTGGPLKFSMDGSGGTDITVCFLAGTQIETPDGETPVEALRAGDLVATLVDGEIVHRPVAWVGTRRMDVARAGADQDLYPIRVRSGAIRDNVPSRDLLVTPEHCLFVEGRLIPARMLVNGASIVVDTDVGEYDYYHVELDSHAILIAEGMEAESYLDTGNRGNFANSVTSDLRPTFATRAGHKSWAADAVAPLTVDRKTVEPIWQAFADRARALGFSSIAPVGEFTDDADLHLEASDGTIIRPSFTNGATAAFVLPAGTKGVRLRSRSARPTDMIGPYIDDRRELGVLVGEIRIKTGPLSVIEDRHITTKHLEGWHASEGGAPFRWTNGRAFLPLDFGALAIRPALLEIEVAQGGPYRAKFVRANRENLEHATSEAA